MSHEQSGLDLALLAHVGDQVQLEDDVVGVVGLELVVVLNLEYDNLLRAIDNSEGAGAQCFQIVVNMEVQ